MDVTEMRRYWDSQFVAARRFMEDRRARDSALIEVAAQHPLVNGDQPGSEFAARLDRGAALFRDLAGEFKTVEVYIPGSRHTFDGLADDVSLSYAGSKYLQDAGIPSHVLHGEDLNIAYKGDAGVYNSADECFVAASYYKDGEFGRLISVVSPAQLFRKVLHYASFGVLPMCFTVPTEPQFHDYVAEAFDNIPYVLLLDHDLQSANSTAAIASRVERMPADR